jgi:hypothetical protein
MHIYGTSDLNICKHRTSVILNQDLRDSKMDHDINPTNDLTDQEREILLAKAKDCLDIITFKPNGTDCPDHKKARANPNRRLISVFGIKNVFTDEEDPGQFSRMTTKKMRAACKMETRHDYGDWTELRERAMGYLTDYLIRKSDSKSICLAELVQFITLKVSLSYLFDDADAASKGKDIFDDVVLIGHQINYLWIKSKKPDDERPKWEDQHELQNALRHVTTAQVPGSYPKDVEDTIKPEDNPLNYLLPAYETMWRVVMRCFIEVQLRDAPASFEWRTILADYLQKLKEPRCMPDAFRKPAKEFGMPPIDIAKEALRLYPPSRHVHREYNGELVRADIEACHHSKLLGGNDPLVFRPERWRNILKEKRDKTFEADQGAATAKAGRDLKLGEIDLGFMPFANYCTADKTETKGFGMKMIVMLVAVLCDGLGDDWKVADEGSLPPLGVALESSREAYLDLNLEKM